MTKSVHSEIDRLIATNSPQFELARQVMPGGVNSSVRIHNAMGVPFFVSRSEGAYIYGLDGRPYLDMCCAHGAALLGHGHPAIVEAVATATKLGFASVFETVYHERLARMLCEAIPSADMVRFCSSGSEATLHLLRACRASTGKNKVIRVEGHFHGYHELLYIGGHPPKDYLPSNRTKPYIESAGIPEEFRNLLIPIPHNDSEVLERTIREHADEVGTLILEPFNWNCGGIKADPGYLELVRRLTREYNIVLFFDEIQAAFKDSLGGAQEDFGVVPDVTTIGKSLGGGFPLSAFLGSESIMSMYKPVGAVQHSGTFNAHLVPVLAGLAFVTEATKPYFYPRLRALGERFYSGVDKIISDHDLNMVVTRHGPRFNVVLGRRDAPRRYEDTFCHDNQVMIDIWGACLERGVYFHDYGGGPVHHGFSIQHNEEDIDKALNVLEESLLIHRSRINALGAVRA